MRYSDKLFNELQEKYGWHDIVQGYLNNNTRIRSITYSTGLVEHVFSFKQRLETGRNVEIETFVSEVDFNQLFPFTLCRLKKRRVSKFFESDNVKWDIDFPSWESGVKHFAMAEVEMPEEMDTPPFIMKEVEPHIVYAVPRSDNRFSARKVSDEVNAHKLALELFPQKAKTLTKALAIAKPRKRSKK